MSSHQSYVESLWRQEFYMLSPRICLSKKFSGDTTAVGSQGPHSENHWREDPCIRDKSRTYSMDAYPQPSSANEDLRFLLPALMCQLHALGRDFSHGRKWSTWCHGDQIVPFLSWRKTKHSWLYVWDDSMESESVTKFPTHGLFLPLMAVSYKESSWGLTSMGPGATNGKSDMGLGSLWDVLICTLHGQANF